MSADGVGVGEGDAGARLGLWVALLAVLLTDQCWQSEGSVGEDVVVEGGVAAGWSMRGGLPPVQCRLAAGAVGGSWLEVVECDAGGVADARRELQVNGAAGRLLGKSPAGQGRVYERVQLGMGLAAPSDRGLVLR